MESITIREAADRLEVSHKVVRRLINQGLVSARKAPGGHGAEWRVEVPSLEAYVSAATEPERPENVAGSSKPARPERAVRRTQSFPDPSPSGREETLQADKRFLQEQVNDLTALLRTVLTGSAPAFPSLAVNSNGGKGREDTLDGQASLHGQGEQGGLTSRPPVQRGETSSVFASRVTEALQSSLASVGTECIHALEMCSVKVLWGKPVLWRVVAEQPGDVAALVEAVLSPEAVWDPPAAEVVFLWARDAVGDVVWGVACGADWFGTPFQDALRQARIERR